MNKIFCPIDFSNESYLAAEWASLLAIKQQSELVLFHKFQIFPDGNTREGSQDVLRDAQREAEEKLIDYKNSLSNKYLGNNIKSSILAEIGIDIDDVIVSNAEKTNADLIVMATNGAESFSDIIGGSNTTNVVENTKIPVVVIPESTVIKLPAKIIYATDLKNEDDENLSFVLNLAHSLDATLVFVYVNEKGNDPKLGRLKEVISSKILDSSHTGKVSNISYDEIPGEDMVSSLQKYTNDTRADMIILGRHPRNFFERILKGDSTRLLALYSTVPLMILHKKQ